MNHPGKSYDDMTLEELQQELREAFLDTDYIDEPLNDELEKMREALNRKRPVEYLYTPEESWERFLEKCADEGAFAPGSIPETQRKNAASPGRYRTFLRTALVAAVVVVLLAGAALAADSLGLWAWVLQWNAGTGRYEPVAMEATTAASIPAALEELGITEPVYPAHMPKGFVITETHISEEPLILVEQYARGDQHISITITPIKGFKNIVYQKQGEAIREYQSGTDIHYILSSERNITAIWYTKNYATTISGDISLDDLKTIIDSIYEESE